MSDEIISNEIIAKVIDNQLEKAFDRLSFAISDKIGKSKAKTFKVYREYMDEAFKDNSKIKTIIHGKDPINLYDLYVDIDVIVQRKEIEIDKISRLLDFNKRFVLVGSGGSGKSTLFQHLFINTLVTGIGIPILINLREFNENDKSIIELIYDTLLVADFGYSSKLIDFSMKNGDVILFLDGFDELREDKMNKVSKDISILIKGFPKLNVIVSSRHDDRFIGWKSFTEVSVLPLSLEKAKLLINKLNYDEVIKNKFLDRIDEFYEGPYSSFVQNPLLLNILLLSYSQFADIPSKIHIFYSQAFETLYFKHDATKDGYKRDNKSGLAIDDFKKVFSAFCAITYSDKLLDFSYSDMIELLSKAVKLNRLSIDVDNFLTDLTSSLCMIVRDGGKYKFVHRSFQEYFCALFINESSAEIQYKLLNKIFNVWPIDRKNNQMLEMLLELNRTKIYKNFFLPSVKTIFDELDINPYSDITLTLKFDLFKLFYSEACLIKRVKEGVEKEEIRWTHNRSNSTRLLHFLTNNKRNELIQSNAWNHEYDDELIKLIKEKVSIYEFPKRDNVVSRIEDKDDLYSTEEYKIYNDFVEEIELEEYEMNLNWGFTDDEKKLILNASCWLKEGVFSIIDIYKKERLVVERCSEDLDSILFD